jgi:hypothetical protein
MPHEVVISGREQRSIDFWYTPVQTEDQTGYYCYIKLTNTDDGLLGFLIRGNDGNVVILPTIEEIISCAIRFMREEAICEE